MMISTTTPTIREISLSDDIAMNRLHTEQINDLIEAQLNVWPEARRNFDALRLVRRKSVAIGNFAATAQLNPARVRSTAAKVDKKSIGQRPCFLCEANRPTEQYSVEWMPGWQLLLNPYPILPVHFTIPASAHIPQDSIPLDMAAMAEAAPDLCIFFNGAHAGASAPDHLHCQAVLKSELPLLLLDDACHPDSEPGWMSSEEFGLSLPFAFLSGVIEPSPAGMTELTKVRRAFGIDSKTGLPDAGLVNAFFRISDSGLLRIVIIPRRAHRPSHYFRDKDNYMISPGALDMAGILVLPREEDFERISPEIAEEIYRETAFRTLPDNIKTIFL